MTLAQTTIFKSDFESFSYNQLSFDHSKLPQKYSVRNPEEIVFRGDVAGLHSQGILSRAFKSDNIERILEAKRIVEGGNDQDISRLIDAHTCSYPFSPFLSTTYNPEMAQFFAPTRFDVHKQPKRTIYRIQISANRAINDIDNIGKSGSCREILVLGGIYPFEIKAFKRVNDDLSSELLTGWLLGKFRLWESTNMAVRDPSNWVEL